VHCNNILIYIQPDATLHSLFYVETTLHVSGGAATHHQELKQLHLQHLVFVTPLLLSAPVVEVGTSLSVMWGRMSNSVVKCCSFEQATYDNVTQSMRFACWITESYKCTLRICNNYCFFRAKMVT
jgi:hypothetical protein